MKKIPALLLFITISAHGSWNCFLNSWVNLDGTKKLKPEQIQSKGYYKVAFSDEGHNNGHNMYNVAIPHLGEQGIIKIYDNFNSTYKNQKLSIRTQRILAAKGYAPKVHGYMSSNDSIRKFLSLNSHSTITDARLAVVMEKIEGASLFSYLDLYNPNLHHYLYLSMDMKKKIATKIKEIENLLNELGVYAYDNQFMINKKTGEVYLIDFENFRPLKDGEVNDFQEEIDFLLEGKLKEK